MNAVLNFLEASLPSLLTISLSAAGVVVAVAMLHGVLGSRLSLCCSHALWLLVFVRLLLPTLPEVPKTLSPPKPLPVQVRRYLESSATAPTARLAHPSSPAVEPPSVAEPRSAIMVTPPPALAAPSTAWSLSRWLTLLWITGAALWLGTVVTGFVLLRRRWDRSAELVDARISALLQSVGREISCRRLPSLHVSPAVRCPVLLGFFKPRLYLPNTVAEHFSDEALRFVFLHELGHLRRGDLWIQLLVTTLQALHWFNPFIAFAARRLRAVAEMSCDAWVLARLQPKDAMPYGQTLLHLLETQSVTRAWPGTVAMAESKRDLSRRIRNLSLRKRSTWISALVLALTAFVALTIPGQTPPVPSTPAHPMATAKVRIVDADGHPIKGAEIRMQGYRISESPASYYGWDSTHARARITTDANGIGAISFPKELSKDEHLIGLDFDVLHTGFQRVRGDEIQISDAVPDIVMNQGVPLYITAVMGPEKHRQPHFLLQSSLGPVNLVRWQNRPDGSLFSNELSAGVSHIRAVWNNPEKDETYFSPITLLKLDGGADQRKELELQPARILHGRLDDTVPRPVINGHVEIYFMPANTGRDQELLWQSGAPVQPDGTFVIRDAPPGDDAYFSAFCRGYCSQSEKTNSSIILSADRAAVLERIKRLHGSPQLISFHVARHIRAEDVGKPLVVPMEPTASVKVKVVQGNGAPVSGASVSLWPNTRFGNISTYFGVPSDSREKSMASMSCAEQRERATQARPPSWEKTLIHRTDARGEAFYENLPACETELYADAETLELPPVNPYPQQPNLWRRSQSIALHSGQTTEATLTLVPKGTTSLPPPIIPTKKAPLQVENPAPKISIFKSGVVSPTPPTWAKDLKTEPVHPDEFAGVVLDTDGKPLAKAGVLSFAVDGFDHWIFTDSQGRFRYHIPSAKGKVVSDLVYLQAEGCCPLTLMQQPSGVYGFITLKKNTWIEGDVRDVDDKPVKGAAVRLEQENKWVEFAGHSQCLLLPYREARTDAAGHYKLMLEPDTYSITVWCRELGQCNRPNIPVTEGENITMNFHADPKTRLEAHFVDSISGQPIPESELTIHFWDIKHEWKSDGQGVATIKGLLPGPAEFWPHHPDYARWWSEEAVHPHQNLEPESNPKTHWQRNFDGLAFAVQHEMKPVTIHMEKAVVIRGRVLDPEGHPVEKATVDPAHTGTGNSLTGDTRFSVETDGQGRYELRIPASNTAQYNLVAHDGKYQQWRHWANGVRSPIQTKPGAVLENVDIQLTRPGHVRGVVVDVKGNPVAHQRVYSEPVERWENRYYNPTTSTDDSGRFELNFVRPGKHYLVAAGYDPEPESPLHGARQILEVDPDQTAEAHLIVGQK